MISRYSLPATTLMCIAVAISPAPAQLALSGNPNLTIAAVAVETGTAVDPSPTPTPAAAVNQDGTAEAERVMVTGSNIPTAAEVGPNPVQTIDRYTIDKAGERTIEELLRNLPVANANAVPTSNNLFHSAQGASSISLRGLDAGATLVLVNGHRIAPFPVGAGGVGDQSFFDIAAMPKMAVDSIEILKDSASSTYGADAIAGVVNIKFRHDYNGAEANVEYGNTTHKDSSEFSSSMLFGVGKGDTNITGVLDYYHRNSIFQADRSYDAHIRFKSDNTEPGNFELFAPSVIAAGGTPPAGAGDVFFGRPPLFTTGTVAASDYTYSPERVAAFNTNKYRASLPETERYGGFLTADHKIYGDQMVAYGDVFYQHVDTHYVGSPPPTFDFGVQDLSLPGTQPFGTSLAIPPHAPGPVVAGPGYEETKVPLGAYNPFNPFQQIISGLSRLRLFEFGYSSYDNYSDTTFATAGLKGDKLFDGSWGYDAAFRYSRSYNQSNWTLPYAPKINRILNAADPIFDPNSPQYIGTTVPYNPFGDYRVRIPNNYRVIKYARIVTDEEDTSDLAVADLNIYTTDLFDLPAGGVGLAFGGQFEYESLGQKTDPRQFAGDVLAGGQFIPVYGHRSENAVYAEASVPVFSPFFTVPGFHALEFTAAVRFEEFLNNNTNVMVPKFGMRWQPFDDSLTIRATWGEGFKQPTLIQLFAPSGAFIDSVFDPVQNKFYDEFRVGLNSNPGLQPEDSRSFSGGIVYTPKFVPGLTLTLDLFDIETTGWVNVNFDYSDVLRRAAEGHLLPGEVVRRGPNGELLQLDLAYENSGTQKVRGGDFTMQYQLQTQFGTFTSLTQATVLDSYQFASAPGETERELRSSGVDFTSDDAYLKWKGMSRLDWAYRGVGFGVTVNYRDGFHEFDPRGLQHWVRQTWFFDLQASYHFTPMVRRETNPVAGYAKDAGDTKEGKAIESASTQTANSAIPIWRSALKGTSVTIGCTNVFDHDPPESFTNYPRFIYDPTGRFIYLSVTKKF